MPTQAEIEAAKAAFKSGEINNVMRAVLEAAERVRQPTGVDYAALLKKYIRHVGTEEGCTFADTARFTNGITAEEASELERLDAEVLNERRGGELFSDVRASVSPASGRADRVQECGDENEPEQKQ